MEKLPYLSPSNYQCYYHSKRYDGIRGEKVYPRQESYCRDPSVISPDDVKAGGSSVIIFLLVISRSRSNSLQSYLAQMMEFE